MVDVNHKKSLQDALDIIKAVKPKDLDNDTNKILQRIKEASEHLLDSDTEENKKWLPLELKDYFSDRKILNSFLNDNITSFLDLFEHIRSQPLCYIPNMGHKKVAYVYYKLSELGAPQDILNTIYKEYEDSIPSRFKEFKDNLESFKNSES